MLFALNERTNSCSEPRSLKNWRTSEETGVQHTTVGNAVPPQVKTACTYYLRVTLGAYHSLPHPGAGCF
ncbi:MAG: hypothetical protein KME46_17025 [Brasilonema angustatum HA4187-MV1]|nr:hypothetical protein [Brasilonema angustatum HA4187-MV1]